MGDMWNTGGVFRVEAKAVFYIIGMIVGMCVRLWGGGEILGVKERCVIGGGGGWSGYVDR